MKSDGAQKSWRQEGKHPKSVAFEEQWNLVGAMVWCGYRWLKMEQKNWSLLMELWTLRFISVFSIKIFWPQLYLPTRQWPQAHIKESKRDFHPEADGVTWMASSKSRSQPKWTPVGYFGLKSWHLKKKEELKILLQEAWTQIDPDTTNKFVELMQNSVGEVIKVWWPIPKTLFGYLFNIENLLDSNFFVKFWIKKVNKCNFFCYLKS